jgi:putative spermidine/putrescine transport system permease protein
MRIGKVFQLSVTLLAAAFLLVPTTMSVLAGLTVNFRAYARA